MYLHLGNNFFVSCKDIVGIFDLASLESSEITEEFIETAKKREEFAEISTEKPHSYIVTEVFGKRKIYASPISGKTLEKRMRAGAGLNF